MPVLRRISGDGVHAELTGGDRDRLLTRRVRAIGPAALLLALGAGCGETESDPAGDGDTGGSASPCLEGSEGCACQEDVAHLG